MVLKMKQQPTNAREGWTMIKVPRANLYKWNSPTGYFGNHIHYKEIREWCEKYFLDNEWFSAINDQGEKLFAFKEPKYATLFRLQWHKALTIMKK
jgi:hypothetical protein